jgi:hypothetical protein
MVGPDFDTGFRPRKLFILFNILLAALLRPPRQKAAVACFHAWFCVVVCPAFAAAPKLISRLRFPSYK